MTNGRKEERKNEKKNLVSNSLRNFVLYSPKEIKAKLDKHVVGQDAAKKVLSVAIYNHYKRMLSEKYGVGAGSSEFDEVTIEKSNIMLLGNTGTGKTFLIQTIAKMLGVPLFVQDCTKLTESGYVGEDVENCVGGLLRQCDFDTQKCEMGIVVLDEVDKLSKNSKGNPSLSRDVGGEGVQQGLLKIVEGCVVGVPPQGGRKHPEQQLCYVDTKNILFIALGAFPGIEKMVERRFNKSAVGFKSAEYERKNEAICTGDILGKVMPEDLKNFGLIPEFIGRFPVVTHTNPLTVDDMLRIITEPKNSLLKQYQKLLSMDNIDLKITNGALREIAEVSLRNGTGARGLRCVLEQILLDIMFDNAETSREKTITIDERFVADVLGEMESVGNLAC